MCAGVEFRTLLSPVVPLDTTREGTGGQQGLSRKWGWGLACSTRWRVRRCTLWKFWAYGGCQWLT